MNGKKKTAAEIIAGVLERNAVERRQRDRARLEFQRIVGLFLDRHDGQRPQG